jgi:hypothetical protein
MPSTTFHEEQRRRPLHCNVVDAMIHQIGADGRMQVHLERDLQLRAYPVHARNQYRVGVLGLIHHKQSTESADLTQHAAGKSLVG